MNKNTSFDEQIFNFSTLTQRVLKIVVAADRYQTATRPFAPQALEKSGFFRPAKPPFPANRYQPATSRAREPLRIGLFLRR